ncbi:MAG: amidase [Chloroflexi bacterium]|nr:amidase [Chloroflexota bacterium]
MAISTELAFTPAYRLRELIAQKQLSPVELAEGCLERIETLNPRLNAFLTVTADEALQAAREAEEGVMSGDELGPLHGIPTSIKDLEDTKGIRTTRGSLAYKDWVPDQDALVVERTKAAGGVILGKTNTPEFGYSGTTENRLGDDCRNPWNSERVSGGSSGGAGASVASGMSPIAQGSDGGGSIRIPSAFCGIYGIKATQGRVPRRHAGLSSWNPVNFSCTGPMTRTVRDAAIFLQVMSGPHPDSEPGTLATEPPDFTASLEQGVKGLRIAWSASPPSAPVDPEVRETAERAAHVFEELGASVEPVEFEVDLEEMWLSNDKLSDASTYLKNGHLLEDKADLLMPYVREAIERGKKVTGAEYLEAINKLERYRAYAAGFFTRYDLLMTPTLAVPAFPCGEPPEEIDGQKVRRRQGYTPFTAFFNWSGNPAASVPCGFSSDGLPIGLHIVGRREDEVTVLQASAAFEDARPWADKIPPVS